MATTSKAQINKRKGILARISVLGDKEETDLNDLNEIIKIQDKLTIVNELILECLTEERVEDEVIEQKVDKQADYLHRVSLVNSSIQKNCKAKNEMDKKQETTSSKTTEKSLPVKLPKVALPKFSGEALEWVSFWDRYVSSIHNQPNLSDVDKMIYLKSCLSGKALATIEGFSLTNNNYQTVIALLKDKFGNTTIIKKTIMDKLLDLPNITANSATSLQAFIDHIECNTRMLYNLDVDPSGFKSALSNMILNQLPKGMRLEILKECGDDWLELDNIMNQLTKLCNRMHLNSLANPANSTSNSQTQKSDSHDNAFAPFKKNYSKSMNVSSHAVTNMQCVFCSDYHWSSDCPNHNLQSRLNLIKSQNRCFKCLKSGHQSKECTSKVHCYTCKKPHHTAVCRQGKNKTLINNSVTMQDVNPKVKESQNDTVVISQAKCGGFNSIMLQVATVYVQSSEISGERIKANILFDTGSQKSFVSQNLAQKIKAQSISTHELNLSVFGQDKISPQKTNLIELSCQPLNNDSVFQLKAFTIPYLTKPIPITPASTIQNIKSFRRLQFAYDIHEQNDLPIDILIGADSYYNFVVGEIRKSESLTATRTVFGWTVSGKLADSNEKHVHINLSLVEINNELNKFWNLENLGVHKEEELHAYHDL